MKKLFGYLPEEDMSYDAILGQVTSDYRVKIIAAVNATFTRGESFNLELKTPLTSLKGYIQLLTAKNRKNEDGFTSLH